MAARTRGSSTTQSQKAKTLALLKPEQAADVLADLLARHPLLVPEAEEIAEAVVTDVDTEAVAQDVESAILGLGYDDLGMRSGRTSSGYVDPSEAAWELLDEQVAPFREDMERQIQLGFEAAATAMCAGIVLGLYRCSGKNADLVLGFAEEFLEQTAGQVVETLARARTGRRLRSWRLPDAIVNQVPEWTELIGRASRPGRRRR